MRVLGLIDIGNVAVQEAVVVSKDVLVQCCTCCRCLFFEGLLTGFTRGEA